MNSSNPNIDQDGGDATSQVVRTKIVATIGPASRDEKVIQGLMEAGVDVFRLNMAHGSLQEHEVTHDRIRRISDALARPVGILVDLAGPKIRLGQLPEGVVECVEGEEIWFVQGNESKERDQFVTNYAPLVDELSVGDSVMIADGTVSLLVEESTSHGVRCRVIHGGIVRSRQGVNLPGVKLSVAAMSQNDWHHAEWAAAVGADATLRIGRHQLARRKLGLTHAGGIHGRPSGRPTDAGPYLPCPCGSAVYGCGGVGQNPWWFSTAHQPASSPCRNLGGTLSSARTLASRRLFLW
ncbi:MAG: pyruvate kinase [Pirellulales bacterium]